MLASQYRTTKISYVAQSDVLLLLLLPKVENVSFFFERPVYHRNIGIRPNYTGHGIKSCDAIFAPCLMLWVFTVFFCIESMRSSYVDWRQKLDALKWNTTAWCLSLFGVGRSIPSIPFPMIKDLPKSKRSWFLALRCVVTRSSGIDPIVVKNEEQH